MLFLVLFRQDVSGKVVDAGVGRGSASGEAVLLPAALCKTMLVAPKLDNPIAPAFDVAVSGTYDSSSDDYDPCDDDEILLEDNDAHQLSLAQVLSLVPLAAAVSTRAFLCAAVISPCLHN